jgi:DNA repair protein RecN (Recombination protein N)
MLVGLSIRDVLLIDRLDLTFEPGLTVLTGETGAGKSILLDSVGLALGARSESGLVRPGATALSVTATFQLANDAPVRALLTENDIAPSDELLLRRVVGSDGRSRAFIDDQPVSVGLLRRVGDVLVEIHGQFANIGLLDPATHLGVLDRFGAIDSATLAACWRRWRDAAQACAAAAAALRKAQGQQDFLRHAVDELQTLNPMPDEEADLASRRAIMMHGEKLIEGMNSALDALNRNDSLRSAERILQRVADKAEGRLDPVIAALDRAATEAEEAQFLLEKASAAIDLDPNALEKIEDRLFALRALARKHGVTVDELAPLLIRLQAELGEIETGGAHLRKLQQAEGEARQDGRGPPSRGRRPRSPGRRRTSPLEARQGAFSDSYRDLGRGLMGRIRLRPDRLRNRHQSRPAARSAGQDRLGRRIVALHAGVEIGVGRFINGADHHLRRGR